MDMSRKLTPEEEKAWTAKHVAGPIGIVIYNPAGAEPMSPRMLLIELLSDVMAGFALAWVLSLTAISVCRGAAAGGLLGLFAWLSLSVSLWNWFEFPGAYILSDAIDQVAGWLLAGLVMALVMRPKSAAS
jgi:hypothetical protein